MMNSALASTFSFQYTNSVYLAIGRRLVHHLALYVGARQAHVGHSAHLVLGRGGELQRELRRGAPGSPSEVCEQGTKTLHAQDTLVKFTTPSLVLGGRYSNENHLGLVWAQVRDLGTIGILQRCHGAASFFSPTCPEGKQS